MKNKRHNNGTDKADPADPYYLLFEQLGLSYCVMEQIISKSAVIDHKCVFVDPYFEKRTGLKNSVGRSVRALFPDDGDQMADVLNNVLLNGYEEQLKTRVGPSKIDLWIKVFSGHATGQVGLILEDANKKVHDIAFEKERPLTPALPFDHGLFFLEVVYNEKGEPNGIRYLKSTIGRNLQIASDPPTGERRLDLFHANKKECLAFYQKVVVTQEAARTEFYLKDQDRWYTAYAAAAGVPGDPFVAVVVDDITERKQLEQRQKLILKFSDALRTEMSEEAIADMALRLLYDQLKLDRCYIALYDLDNDIADIPYQLGNEKVNILPDHIKLSDFPNALYVTFNSTLIIDDIHLTAGLSNKDRKNISALGLRALVAATLRKNENRPLWCIVAVSSEPRKWTVSDTLLIEEVTERTWGAINTSKAQNALRESEQRLRSIANLVPHLLWDSEPNGSTNWYNQRWLEYTGQLSEQAIGWGWVDAIHPEDRALSAKRYAEAVEAGKLLRQEHRIRRFDGEYRWFVVNAAPVISEEGQVVKVYGSATDVHDQKLAEEALRISEEKYRTLFESIDEGFLIHEMIRDDTGKAIDLRLLEVNPSFTRQSGLSTDVVGKRASEFMPNLDGFLIDTYDRVARSGIAERLENYNNETQRWYDIRISSMRGKDNQVAVLFEDATERKKIEQNLHDDQIRQAFILRLGDALRAETEEDAIKERTVRMLGKHLAVDRCYISEVFEEQGYSTVGPEYLRPGIRSMAGRYQLADYPETQRQMATRPLVINDADNDPRFSDEQKALLGLVPQRALLVAPLRRGRQQMIWAMAVAMGTPRQWTEAERSLLEDVAERTWLAIERTRTAAALRESEAQQRSLLDLSDALRTATDPLAAMAIAVATLGRRSGTVVVDHLVVQDDDKDLFGVHARYENDHVVTFSSEPLFTVHDRDLGVNISHGEVVFVDDGAREHAPFNSAPYAHLEIRSGSAIPLTRNGRTVAILITAGYVAREWSESDKILRREVAERTWATVERITAEQALLKAHETHRLQLEKEVKDRTAELQLNQQLLQATLDSNLEMIQVFQAVRDNKGHIIDFIWILNNATTEKIYGDVIGKSLLKNNPGIKDTGIFDTFVAVTETGIATKHERHYTHEQFEGWYYQSVVKLNDGVATTTVNITERKKAEMQLQDGRDRLRSILDTTLVQMSILEAVRDIKGKIVDLKILAVNKELEKETGRNNLVNKLYATEYPGIREAGLFDLIVKAIDTDEPQSAEYFYSHEDFHKWFSCTFVKFGDGVVATNMDITDRKSAEEERFKNYLLLKQSEEIASLGSWEYDILPSKLRWSDGMYRLFQLDHHLNVSPAVYLEHSTSSGKKNAKHVLHHIEKGDRDLDKTIEILIKGKVRTLVIRATILRNDQGQPVKVLGVDMDVTAMRETEKKLLKMRSEQQLEIFRETLKVQEEERRRISESLHNGLGQLLYGIKISLTDFEAKDAINDPKSFSIKRAYTDNCFQTRSKRADGSRMN